MSPSMVVLAPRRPRVRQNLAVRQIDDATLVYDPGDDQSCLLDRSAAAVLRLCDGTRDVDRLVTEFASMLKIPTSIARQSCGAALRGLLANRLLHPAPTYARSVHRIADGPWYDGELAIGEDMPRTLGSDWSVCEQYGAGPSRLLVHGNIAGLAQTVLGSPTASYRRGDAGATADDVAVIQVHRDAGAGIWTILRAGRVRSRTALVHAFETHLRAEVRAVLLERHPQSILLPARLPDRGTTLVLHVEVPRVADATCDIAVVPVDDLPFLLVAADAAGEPNTVLYDRLDMALVAERELRGVEQLVLRDLCSTDAGAARLEFTREQCLPRLLAATVSFGPDQNAGFTLLEQLVARCRRFVCEADSEERCRSLVADVRDIDVEPTDASPDFILAGDCVPRLADGVMLHEVGGHTVAILPGAAAPVLLDRQARALLGLADGATTVDEIAAVTQEVFHADRSEVYSRLRQLFRTSQRVGLVQILPRGGVPQGKAGVP